MADLIQHPAVAAMGSKAVRDIPCADSSFIQAFKYDPSTFQLTVTMKSGAQYLHFYVYPMTVDQLIQSPSKGKFYSQMIKGKQPGVKTINKSIGPENRNPLKGPIHHDKQRQRKQIARTTH